MRRWGYLDAVHNKVSVFQKACCAGTVHRREWYTATNAPQATETCKTARRRRRKTANQPADAKNHDKRAAGAGQKHGFVHQRES
eukprot:gene17784-biopygen2356